MNAHLLRIVTLLAYVLLWSALRTRAADGAGLVGETEKLKARIAQLETRLDRSEKRSGVSAITTNGMATVQFGKLWPNVQPNTQVAAGKLELSLIAIDENLNEVSDSKQHVELRWDAFTMPPPPYNSPPLVRVESSADLQPYDLKKIKGIVLQVQGPSDSAPGTCGVVDFDLFRATSSQFLNRLAQKYPQVSSAPAAPGLVTTIPVNSRVPNNPPAGHLWGSIPILLKIEERR
jgi:hypothetical protein